MSHLLLPHKGKAIVHSVPMQFNCPRSSLLISLERNSLLYYYYYESAAATECGEWIETLPSREKCKHANMFYKPLRYIIEFTSSILAAAVGVYNNIIGNYNCLHAVLWD